MPTGACGINCDVCKLRLLGTCSSCGSGKSEEARKKLEAQKRSFGGTCPILECACLNRLEYCIRDCPSFPCENFSSGPYPFGQDFLDMQKRRRKEVPEALDPHGHPVKVPSKYWDTIQYRDINTLCNLTIAEPYESGGLIFPFLQKEVLVRFKERSIYERHDNGWEKLDNSLLELITLIYLNRVESFYPLGKELVSKKDLKEAHYFKGEHDLKLGPLLERYSNDPNGFDRSCRYLGGKAVEMGDSGFRLLPFPRVPLYYLYWEGDEEFAPRISVLFERSIETVFPTSAIWGLVSLVSTELLKGPANENFP